MAYRYQRQRHSRHQDGYGDFKKRRRAGWGMNLYRNTRNGKIGGVAAGLADHWDIAPWVVRLLWFGAFLFTGMLAVWAYIGAWILLAPRPRRVADDGLAFTQEDESYEDIPVDMEYDERYHEYRPRKVFRYSENSSVRLRRAQERLNAAVARVEAMESYVTSRQYRLNKEFSRL